MSKAVGCRVILNVVNCKLQDLGGIPASFAGAEMLQVRYRSA
jgi:hypothetical protein